MPTDNPKVSGYVPQAVYNRLIQFKDEQGISISQAVTIVLAEYFGVETEIDMPTFVGGVTLARVNDLEEKVAQLQKAFQLSEASELSNKLSDEPLTNTQSEPLKKTQKELASHLGIHNSTLCAHTKKKSSEELIAYTRPKDSAGLGWFYLPEERLYQQEPESFGELQGGLLLE